MASSCDVNPTPEKTSVFAPAGTVMLNIPSVLVEVAFDVPFTVTVIPGTPAPLLSVTLPEAIVCAYAPTAPKATSMNTQSDFKIGNLIFLIIAIVNVKKNVYFIHKSKEV